jgi:MFS superfamily sulfate permease-like transporter
MTFLAIIATDLLTGIFAGVMFSVVYFAYRYSLVRRPVSSFNCGTCQAGVVHSTSRLTG